MTRTCRRWTRERQVLVQVQTCVSSSDAFLLIAAVERRPQLQKTQHRGLPDPKGLMQRFLKPRGAIVAGLASWHHDSSTSSAQAFLELS